MSRRLRVVERELWTPPRAEVKVHNHFKLELFKAKTGKKLMEAEAENVVTNSGRLKLANSGCFDHQDFMGGCALGTGTNAPSPTDVTMGANLKSIAGVALTSQVLDALSYSIATGNWWKRHKFYFPELVANYSLTEVGLMRGSVSSSSIDRGSSSNNTTYLSAGTPLSTRALFRDANGDPISVTKTNTQIMVITATVYMTRGGVDSGMRLLDNFFARQMDYAPSSVTANNTNYMSWFLGDGSAAPTNADTTLSGTQLASKADPSGSGSNRVNKVFWTSSGWLPISQITNDRPGEKPYTSAYSVDWDLNEGNVTFSEVLTRQQSSSSSPSSNASQSAVHIVFPCGTVAGATATKNNTQKMRQYMEISW